MASSREDLGGERPLSHEQHRFRDETARAVPSTLDECLRDPEAVVEREIWEAVRSGAAFVFVTGSAGTGKSHFLELLARAMPTEPAILAPTGLAALGVGGQTIHSFFKLDRGVQRPGNAGANRAPGLYRSLSSIFFDESSMVRADAFDKVDEILRWGRSSDTPFGGVQIIMVGDLLQLPPVVEKKEEAVLGGLGYKGSYFFDSHVARQACRPATFVLERIHRQRDPGFARLLNRVRLGTVDTQTLRHLNTRVFPESMILEEGGLVLTTRVWRAEMRNEQHLQSLPGPEHVYRGQVRGKFSRAKLPVPAELRLRVGARVMFRKNHPDQKWQNGTLGTLLECGRDHLVVDRGGDGGPCRVERTTWETQAYSVDPRSGTLARTVIGSYRQFPVMLGWAVTIHRSQGLSLDRVHVDLTGGVFSTGQAYVALSRARTLQGLTLERPIRRGDIMVDARVVDFMASTSKGTRSAA